MCSMRVAKRFKYVREQRQVDAERLVRIVWGCLCAGGRERQILGIGIWQHVHVTVGRLFV